MAGTLTKVGLKMRIMNRIFGTISGIGWDFDQTSLESLQYSRDRYSGRLAAKTSRDKKGNKRRKNRKREGEETWKGWTLTISGVDKRKRLPPCSTHTTRIIPVLELAVISLHGL